MNIVEIGLLLAVVGGAIWAYGHVKAFHDKLDAIIHRNTAVDSQIASPSLPSVSINLPPAPSVVTESLPLPGNSPAFPGLGAPANTPAPVYDPVRNGSWLAFKDRFPIGTQIYSPDGLPLDMQGNPIVPGGYGSEFNAQRWIDSGGGGHFPCNFYQRDLPVSGMPSKSITFTLPAGPFSFDGGGAMGSASREMLASLWIGMQQIGPGVKLGGSLDAPTPCTLTVTLDTTNPSVAARIAKAGAPSDCISTGSYDYRR